MRLNHRFSIGIYDALRAEMCDEIAAQLEREYWQEPKSRLSYSDAVVAEVDGRLMHIRMLGEKASDLGDR